MKRLWARFRGSIYVLPFPVYGVGMCIDRGLWKRASMTIEVLVFEASQGSWLE